MTNTLSFDDILDTLGMLAYLRADADNTLRQYEDSDDVFAQQWCDSARERIATLDRLLAIYRAM